MIDMSKIREYLENHVFDKFDFIRNKEEEEKVMVEETIKMLDKFLKMNIDDLGHYMVDDKIYDYESDEFVRYTTEEELEMLYTKRNLERQLKNM